MADHDVVTWREVDARTNLVLLERPPANALGLPLIDGLGAAIDAAESREQCRVLVIASRIPGIFVAGADIKHMAAADPAVFAAYGAALRPQVERLASSRLITIAAVDGLALGGGMEMAMACTLRVAGAGSRFGLPEAKLGLIPGAGGTQRLPRLVGQGRALDIMMTARQVPAPEAVEIGLVDRLADEGEAETAALELARELQATSIHALMAIRRCVETSYDATLGEGLAQEAAESMQLFTDGDAREGLAAFVDKRPPAFD